jgi:hypothetical protein
MSRLKLIFAVLLLTVIVGIMPQAQGDGGGNDRGFVCRVADFWAGRFSRGWRWRRALDQRFQYYQCH